MEKLEVHICENDDNGNPSGFAWRLEFSIHGETFLRLESHDLFGGVALFTNDRIIDYQTIRVKHSGRSLWAGTMKWNRYAFPPEYGLGFLNLMLRTKKWGFEEGWSSIHDLIESGELITGKDIELNEDYQPMLLNPNQYEIPFFNQNQ